jgi:DNA-binding SARP family transcriptional activator/predicted ATPase
MAHLSLTLLGGFEAALDAQPLTAFEYDKVRALLAYLAVEADHPHRRETLAGLLWPDRPERNARQNLSQTLFSLRRVIGDRQAQPAFLNITPQTLQFNPSSDYHLDVTTFTTLVADCKAHNRHRLDTCDLCSEKLQRAAALYRGEFLEGFSLPDSSAFEEWSLLNREWLHRLAVETLHHLADYYQRRNDFEEALQYAWRYAELEPWQEKAHRQLMRLLAFSGQREAALVQYETCRRLLNDELGIKPAAETTRLYEQIRDGKRFSLLPPRPLAPLPSFPVAAPQPSSPPATFVARERELAQLDEFLDLALAGQGRVVFVTGNTGLGKTMLMQEFARRAQATQPDLIVVGGNGNAHTGLGDPYLPFREVLGLLTGDLEARWAIGTITQDHAGRLWDFLPASMRAVLKVGPDLVDTFVAGAALAQRAEAFAQWAGSADGLPQLEELIAWKETRPGSANRQQSDLFEQYTRVLRTLARQKPLLLLLDDLQWADPGSVSLLFHLGRRIEDSRILLVGAYRPADVTMGRPLTARHVSRQNEASSGYRERHPLEPVVNEFKRLFGAIEVDLSQAEGRRFVDAFLDSMPNRLGDTFRQKLYRQTGGHPLFTIELLRSMQDRGDLVQDQQDRWIEGPTLDWDTLPARVEAVITERIERLSDELRETLAVACVEGETFTAEVIARARSTSEPEMVRRLSDKLERAHRLVNAQGIRKLEGQQLSLYRFRHILFQNYLYNSLDSAERIYLHQAVGTALETLYGEQTGEIAVQLARHFEEAKNPEKAVDYLRQAGERAVRMSANEEAIAHLTRGLALLEKLPDSPEHARQELALQTALSMPLIAVEGYGAPEVGHAYSRMEELSQQLGEVTLQFRALFSKLNFCGQQGEQYKANQMARQALSLADQTDDPALVMLAHFMMGVNFLFLGKFALARTHLEQMMVIYDPQQHHDLAFYYGQDIGVPNLSWLCWALWSLGYPDQALQRNREALTLAKDLDHPLTSGHYLGVATMTFHHLGQDVQMTQSLAEACIRLATEHRLPVWLAVGAIYRGRALVEQGHIEAGLTQMQQGLADYEATGAKLSRSLFLATLAEVYGKTGQVEEGLALLAEALVFANQGGERLWEADIYRLKGELLLKAKAERRKASPESPEDCFLEAIKIARAQQAKFLELRATMSLCRLWQKQGKREKARQMLVEIYNWFSEGFDTADLKEAKELLR